MATYYALLLTKYEIHHVNIMLAKFSLSRITVIATLIKISHIVLSYVEIWLCKLVHITVRKVIKCVLKRLNLDLLSLKAFVLCRPLSDPELRGQGE